MAAIRDLGLELQMIFNRGAVMVLPAGVNKATGPTAALDSLGLTAHEVVGVGDAENDHAFLSLCEFFAAVANALPALKEVCRLGDPQRGRGRSGRINRRIDRQRLEPREANITRHRLLLGSRKVTEESGSRPAARIS